MAEEEVQQQQINPEDFVKSLAEQAESLIPEDISEDDKKYIAQLVYTFCGQAYQALMQDDKIPPEHIPLITQFIGEWTFHKAIDLIRAEIMPQFREEVLRVIAFTIFEIAPHVLANMAQAQVVMIIEHKVKEKYIEALTELKEKGRISPEEYESAMNQSNIDKMAEEEQQLEEEFPGSKLPKLATLAMVLQKMPQQKVESVIARFPENEAEVLRKYIALDNLDQMIDAESVKMFLAELKTNIPGLKKTKAPAENIEKNIEDTEKSTEEKNIDNEEVKFETIVTKKNESKINDIILKERAGVKEYVTSIIENKGNSSLSEHVADVINSYLMEKFKNAYQKKQKS